jgi:hypothetical protein
MALVDAIRSIAHYIGHADYFLAIKGAMLAVCGAIKILEFGNGAAGVFG